MVPIRTLLLAAIVPLVLAGCSGNEVSRTFGLAPSSPNEFEVTTQAPLSMPPNYLLRPPEPGAPRPQTLSEARQAEATLVPQAALQGGNGAPMSAGQQALLQAAGPPVSAGVRNQVDAAAAKRAENGGFLDKVMFWKKPAAPGTLVDPQREAKRLRENAALGESPLNGDTPIIQRHSNNSLWDMLF